MLYVVRLLQKVLFTGLAAPTLLWRGSDQTVRENLIHGDNLTLFCRLARWCEGADHDLHGAAVHGHLLLLHIPAVQEDLG